MLPVRAADPIHAVLKELTTNGEPSLAWVIAQCGADGGDPVRDAWLASSDPDAMLLVLMTLDHPKWMDALPLRERSTGQSNNEVAEQVRRLLGDPLTLDYVMAQTRTRPGD